MSKTRRAVRDGSHRLRYGLRWHLRDVSRTISFTARHRPLRYAGCAFLAGAALALAITAVTWPDDFELRVAGGCLVLAGVLLVAGSFRGVR
jgi:hypothetical protein